MLMILYGLSKKALIYLLLLALCCHAPQCRTQTKMPEVVLLSTSSMNSSLLVCAEMHIGPKEF